MAYKKTITKRIKKKLEQFQIEFLKPGERIRKGDTISGYPQHPIKSCSIFTIPYFIEINQHVYGDLKKTGYKIGTMGYQYINYIILRENNGNYWGLVRETTFRSKALLIEKIKFKNV